MMKFTNRLIQLLAISTVAFLLATACSDDTSTGPDESDPPEIPEVEEITVDRSYFESADAGTSEEYYTFNSADNYSASANSALQSYLNLGGFYYQMIESTDDANYENGMWVWEYTYDTITIRYTLEQTNAGSEWNMYLDGSDPETGENYDNVRLMSGFTSADNDNGEWAYYDPETSQTTPVIYYEWNYDSDDDYWMELTFTEDGANEQVTLSYVKNGPNNTVESNNMYGSGLTTVYWNSESLTGYFDENGERTCWNDSFVTTSCSELGY
ncbi:hypothetical protein [Rhodohalobacter halophilus]|uniref:hypothetical protein n=1 Tax=Rhodohalobacter halophilus TaxID=1812810 RepID=UPI00083F9318|nr:hypothetical protein [Rhodohalobacter halophilus]